MTDIVVFKTAETATTVTLEWLPVAGAHGYVFLYGNGRSSSTLDGSRTTLKIAKVNLPVEVRAGRTLASGVYPPTPSPPRPVLHTHRLTVQPGGYDPDSGAGNKYAFCYAKFRSPTTRYINDGNPRTIAWSPGELYVDRDLTVLWEVGPEKGAQPNRVFNLHCHPNYGGWEPDNSNGVSPVALDWWGDMNLVLQAEGARTGNYTRRWLVASKAEIDAARSAGLMLRIRLDVSIGYLTGRVVGYLNDQQRFDTGQVATHWPSQTGYSLWEGIYNSEGIPSVEEHTFVAARVGRTLAEAVADSPEEVSVIGSRMSSGTNAWTHKVIVA